MLANELPALGPEQWGLSAIVERIHTLAETEGNIKYSAAYLRMLSDLRTDKAGPHYDDLDDMDMLVGHLI